MLGLHRVPLKVQKNVVAEALETLDDRSRDILRRRWLTEEKETLHELADEYGISAERVRQVEAAAIGKLRKAMAN